MKVVLRVDDQERRELGLHSCLLFFSFVFRKNRKAEKRREMLLFSFSPFLFL
jgi:hypothetical protein